MKFEMNTIMRAVWFFWSMAMIIASGEWYAKLLLIGFTGTFATIVTPLYLAAVVVTVIAWFYFMKVVMNEKV